MRSFLFLLVLLSALHADYRVKLFARSGGIDIAEYMAPVCGDFNHDDTTEIAYLEQYRPRGFQVWKFIPPRQFVLARMDTSPEYPVPGQVTMGQFRPVVMADVNDDGREELVGWGLYKDSTLHTRSVVEVIGYKPNSRYPDTILWWRSYFWQPEQTPVAVVDLDGDGIREIIYNSCYGNKIVEHRGFNQFDSVASFTGGAGFGGFPAADFDQDGHQEFVTSNGPSVTVFKCLAEDSFSLVAEDTIWPLNNHIDLFTGQNVDGTNVPKFFTVPNAYGGPGGETYYLYMGAWLPHRYVYTLIDTVKAASDWGRVSKCGDIDGDGLEEIVWSVGAKVTILKWNGDRFERVWTWHRPVGSCSLVEIFDLNQDGYNDFLISGADSTYYFEVEAVRLLSPNGGEEFLPGDSVSITWETFSPPRCDSVALCYSLDSGRTWLPIARGLSPGETCYTWVAPDVRSTTCLIKAVAYGPGSVFDESDSCFSITSTGLSGAPARHSYRTCLFGVQPNPMRDQARIRFTLRDGGRARLRVKDVTGRTVVSLFDGTLPPGNHELDWRSPVLAHGIYFLELEAGNYRRNEKLTIE